MIGIIAIKLVTAWMTFGPITECPTGTEMWIIDDRVYCVKAGTGGLEWKLP